MTRVDTWKSWTDVANYPWWRPLLKWRHYQTTLKMARYIIFCSHVACTCIVQASCTFTVGYHRCATWLHGQCLSHYRPMLIWKVTRLIICIICVYMYTDVLSHAYMYSNKRILACSTVSRKEHSIAQTREVVCTKLVLPQVLEQGLYFDSSFSHFLDNLCYTTLLRFERCGSSTWQSGSSQAVHHWWSEAPKLVRHLAW